MSPTPHKIIQPSAEQIDRHLDNVLTRAGSGLRHYTMHRSLELMRNAMRDALIEAAQAQAAGPELQQIDEPLDGRTHHITDEQILTEAQSRMGASAVERIGTSAVIGTVRAVISLAAPAPAVPMSEVDLHDDDALRFAQRVLESDAPESDRKAARDMLVAIRTRVRKARAALTAAPTPPAQQPVEFEGRVIVGHSKHRGGWFVYEECVPGEYTPIKGPFASKEEADAAMRDPSALLIHPEPAVPEDVARDAERYRWLRGDALYFGFDDRRPSPWCVVGSGADDCSPIDGDNLDTAIDAARSAEKGGE